MAALPGTGDTAAALPGARPPAAPAPEPPPSALPAAGSPAERIEVGDLVIDRERFLVTVGADTAALTYMEFRALYLIAAAGGRVASYEALAGELWGDGGRDHRRRLAVLVSRIRSRLGPCAGYLQTVRQVGYRLAPAPARP